MFSLLQLYADLIEGELYSIIALLKKYKDNKVARKNLNF